MSISVVSGVYGDQQHTQHAQAAKKVLAYPILQWNLYQCPSFENSCGLRGWSMVEHDGFFAVLLSWVVDINILHFGQDELEYDLVTEP